jgi:LPS-assembly protein
MRKLRGAAKVDTSTMTLQADEIDYDEERGYAEARGHVIFDHYEGGEHIEADRVEYNLKDETGRYYEISGFSPAKIESRPGVLTTANPFSFRGKWAERFQDKYVLHDGMITDCRLPNPWWTLRGTTFDIIPGERAIAHNTVFRLRRVPLFYSPLFYRSLEKAPRQSGFLLPNIGNSSRRGKMIGVGYFWAINRSYDTTYRAQWFTERGVAHHFDFRGKPTDRSDFDVIVYGVNDRGLEVGPNFIRKEGGFLATLTGKADLAHGWYARGDLNYLSSYRFRQAFTESFYEAVFSESHSSGFVTKHWDTFGVSIVGSRIENFTDEVPVHTESGGNTIETFKDQSIVIRRAPSVEFNSREHEISDRILPIWVSFDTSAGFLNRNQLQFSTRQWVERVDFAPRVMTTMSWKDFHFTPSFGIRETSYGSSRDASGNITGNDVLRSSRDFSLDFRPPSLAKVFDSPSWLGKKLKHVIEPDVQYRFVTGINDFDRYIRFDETELESNTNEVEISITNRIYAKKKDDRVEEVFSWRVAQKRFFDPTFGGAVTSGRRNVVLSEAMLTGYAFLDGPRNYSPIVSTVRVNPDYRFGIEWRTDYDPLRGRIVNSSTTADARFAQYFVSIGHDQIRTSYLQDGTFLLQASNQMRGTVGFGQDNKRGWSSAFTAIYDYNLKQLQYATTQITYNTDCCGWSVQFRRFSFGARNENQFRVAFAVANIGSFGTLKRQERLF